METFFRAIQKLRLAGLDKKLDTYKLPVHIGLILDGNRRYAKKMHIARKQGHASGIAKFREVLGWAYKYGIKHVTIWVFSSENWSREKQEIDDITDLFIKECLHQLESGEFVARGIRFRAIGDYSKFPSKLKKLIQKVEEATSKGTKLQLNVAIGYGGRQEVVQAVNNHIQSKPGTLMTEDDITKNTYLADQPTPDFIIRTSGEYRHSGFLLWHSPYAEYYFVPVFWPEISQFDFARALIDYQNRKRRFGK